MSTVLLCAGAECNASFLSAKDLQAHLSLLHCHYTPFECAVCHLQFPTQQRLTKHWAQAHPNEGPVQAICNYDDTKDEQLLALVMQTNKQSSDVPRHPMVKSESPIVDENPFLSTISNSASPLMSDTDSRNTAVDFDTIDDLCRQAFQTYNEASEHVNTTEMHDTSMNLSMKSEQATTSEAVQSRDHPDHSDTESGDVQCSLAGRRSRICVPEQRITMSEKEIIEHIQEKSSSSKLRFLHKTIVDIRTLVVPEQIQFPEEDPNDPFSWYKCSGYKRENAKQEMNLQMMDIPSSALIADIEVHMRKYLLNEEDYELYFNYPFYYVGEMPSDKALEDRPAAFSWNTVKRDVTSALKKFGKFILMGEFGPMRPAQERLGLESAEFKRYVHMLIGLSFWRLHKWYRDIDWTPDGKRPPFAAFIGYDGSSKGVFTLKWNRDTKKDTPIPLCKASDRQRRLMDTRVRSMRKLQPKPMRPTSTLERMLVKNGRKGEVQDMKVKGRSLRKSAIEEGYTEGFGIGIGSGSSPKRLKTND